MSLNVNWDTFPMYGDPAPGQWKLMTIEIIRESWLKRALRWLRVLPQRPMFHVDVAAKYVRAE